MSVVRVYVQHPYTRMNTNMVWKKSRVILTDRLDFQVIDSHLVAFQDFTMRLLTSFSEDDVLLPRYMNWSTDYKVEMNPFCLKRMNLVLLVFTQKQMPPAVFSRLGGRDLACAGVFVRSATESV